MRSYLAIVARPELPCLFPPPLASSSPLVNCAHSFPFLLIRSNLAGVHGQNFTPPLYFRTSRVRSYQQFTLFLFLPPSVFRLLVLFRSYLAGVARPELQRSPARYLSCFMQSLSAPHASKSPRLYSSHSGSQVGSHSLTDLWRTKISK